MTQKQISFSPRRVAWVTASISMLLVPVHFWVSCAVSGRLAIAGAVLVAITAMLSLADKGKSGAPIGIALVSLVGHTLCTH